MITLVSSPKQHLPFNLRHSVYDLLTEIRWHFDTGNVEIPLFLFLRMNTTLSNIWNKPLQNIKFQFDNGTKSVFLSIMWTETEAKEPAIISKKFHSGEQDWTIGLICEINFLKKTILKGINLEIKDSYLGLIELWEYDYTEVCVG